MTLNSSLFQSNLVSLPLIGRGKVRDIYAVGNDRLLMVACDRLSAFDVVMNEPIPGKGELLTEMTVFWFKKLEYIVPNHLTGVDPSAVVNCDSDRTQIANRSLVVKRLRPIPIEAVVRGYIAGSAWAEYKDTSTVCSIPLPSGITNAGKLAEPIFTPAIKAAPGEHDRNISFGEMHAIVGPNVADKIKSLSIAIYNFASGFALSRGIIIADTKFEFGLDKSDNLVLMDEVLTPDSSRFWPIETYQSGRNPPSFDKQFVRDWLENFRQEGEPWNKKAPPPPLPLDVRVATSARYREALERLRG